MGNMISRRYRYGASFIDGASGVRFEGHHPHERPDLWKLYLHEAEGRYRNFGFEGKLHLQDLDEGNGVPLFFLGFRRRGNAVAGVRCHGPFESSHQAFMLQEMGGIARDRHDGPHDRRRDPPRRHGDQGCVVEGRGGHRSPAHRGHRPLGHPRHELARGRARRSRRSRTRSFSAGTANGRPDAGRRLGPLSRRALPDRRAHRGTGRAAGAAHARAAVRRCGSRASSSPAVPNCSGSGRSPPTPRRRRRGGRWSSTSGRATQREVLRVLREDPSLQVIDRLAEQREQLSDMKPPPAPSLEEEAQRWIYYPWRRAVVRLLGPRAFGTLRLDRNRNKITRAEQARQRTLRIGVIGLSAGHSIAHVLAMEGLAGELRLADFDTVELSNLNRIPASVLDLGVNKAVVAARRIGEIDPYLRVVTIPEGITPENLGGFLDGLDLVIEECDSLDVKLLVREAARERRIPVLMETSDRGVLDVERFDLEPDRPIFHGLLPGVHSSDLAGLSIQQKAPYVLRILGAADITSRGAASLLEVGETVTGWPQLGSEVTLGAATAAAAVRRLGLNGRPPLRPRPLRRGRDAVGHRLVETRRRCRDTRATASRRRRVRTLRIARPMPIRSRSSSTRRAGPRPAGTSSPGGSRPTPSEIRMYLVPERTTTMDVRHRGSYVAIGAALFNARVAAASLKNLGRLPAVPRGLAVAPRGDAAAWVRPRTTRSPVWSPGAHACRPTARWATRRRSTARS